MARSLNKLSARTVSSLVQPGRHSDGGGLYAFISEASGIVRRRWIYRYVWRGVVKEMGLGSLSEVSLKDARELRNRWRQELTAGRNPIEVRDTESKAAQGAVTFGACADAFLASKSSEWRNEKHRAQWKMTLDKYALPLRGLAVEAVDTDAVLGCLQPLWQEKPETASRLRGRIEVVLDSARAKGFIPRNEANPARWRGHLDKLLPKRQKLTRGHHAAMPYAEVPAFVAKLRERDATAALALEFAILTAARSGEVLRAEWSEFDLNAAVWTVPANRMKAGRAHRVPLSGQVLEMLQALVENRTGNLVFEGSKKDRPLSSMSMEMVLRRMKIESVTVHGFRSSFRDWCGEATSFPREIAEAALAHVIGDKAEQAYRRGDALEKRRALMDAWASFCEQTPHGNVVILARKT